MPTSSGSRPWAASSLHMAAALWHYLARGEHGLSRMLPFDRMGLENDGLIGRYNPRAIHIADWRKLADVGDFDSTYLHLDNEPALM